MKTCIPETVLSDMSPINSSGKSRQGHRVRVKEVLAQLEDATRQYKALNPPKTTIIPGCGHCKLLNENKQHQQHPIVPRDKPMFLTKLELSIANELQKIESGKCSSNCEHLTCRQKRSDAELKTYRSAFDALLGKIATFKPLLERIKFAYEECIEVKDCRLELMEIVSVNLDKFKRDVEWQIERIKTRGMDEINSLVAENNRLSETIASLKAQLEGSNKIMADLKTELSEIRGREILEISGSRRCIALSERHDVPIHDNGNTVENQGKLMSMERNCGQAADPVLLSMCLQRTRKDLSTAHRRITELEETFRDVVPKRDLEKLENAYQALKRDRDAVTTEIKSLVKEYTGFKLSFDKVNEQKDSLRDRCKILAHTNTPRPDWSKCGQFIQGGVQRWRDITAKKSSEDRLTILLSELCGAASAENDFFVGQGTDPSVPVFLRYKGKVKNRKLGRREVSILINDIWKNKVIADEGTPMGDYILKYFTERYHLPLMRYEWIYNLYNACQRLMYDDQIGLFWEILWGNIVEDAYNVPRKNFIVMKKMMEMRMEDKKINALLAEDIMDIVDTMYPYKTNEDIENIVYAAAKQLGIDPSTEAFDIAKLFAAHEEGWERGEFPREFTRQTAQEMTEFGKAILNRIHAREKTTQVGVDTLRKGFMEVDEGIPQTLLTQHLKWIYKVQDLGKAKPMASSTIIRQMVAGYIRMKNHPKKTSRREI